MADMHRPGHVALEPFHGGLALPDNKSMSSRSPIRVMPIPGELAFPLAQHIGSEARPIVAVGETVKRGQRIAEASTTISANIHASSSGVVVAIEPRPIPHPSGLNANCIVIRTDGLDTALPPHPGFDWTQATPAAIRQCIRDSGIVGLGGAAFPTDIKLDPETHPELESLILNGAECEPYISCDEVLMRDRAIEIITGARIMLRALGIDRCRIALEDNKQDAFAALAATLNETNDNIELIQVPSVYPEGGERQLIQVLTGKEVPQDGLPHDIGVVCHNVGTAAAVYRAVASGEPLIRRVVTVTGKGIVSPGNVEVRLGCSFADVIRYCGGYAGDTARLIMGGPMMGFAIATDEVPVIKASNCILVPSADEIAPPRETMPCIRCGECAEVCPASLLPQTLYWHSRARDFERVENFDIFDCIECGCCDLVCPSHIPLASYFRFAKTEIWGRDAERAKADIARLRFEARQQRLAEEKAEQLEKRRAKEAALKKMQQNDEQASMQSEIAAALERKQQKDTSGDKE